MNARSRGSITSCGLAVLIALAAQLPRAAHAESLGEYLAVRSNALTCIDRKVPAAKRIEACTTVIGMADKGVSSARTHVELIYLARGTAFQKEGNDQAALTDFESATHKGPQSELAWLGLGNFDMAQSDYAHALESFDRAVKFGSKDPAAYNDRGAALTGLKRYGEALPDFARAIALDPEDTVAMSNRATLYLASNRANLALVDLDTVLRKEPFNARAFYNRGLAYERTDALEKAVEDFRSAVRIQPFGQAYEALGRVLAKKDPQAALAELSEAIRLDPHSPALRSRAIVYLSLDRFEPAVHDLDLAIADDSSDEIAYIDRGVAEEELGHDTVALADFSRSIQIETTTAALVDRGSIYQSLGQREKALADFDAALAIEPNNVAALIGRADANYAPDEHDPQRLAGSLGDFSRVIAASPKSAGAYYVRGDIHFDLKQYAAAYGDFSRSLELDPDQPSVLFNRALTAEQLGRSAEAARDRQAARLLDASIRAHATATREVAGSPTQIEYAAPRNVPEQEQPRVVFAAPRAAPEGAPPAAPEAASTAPSGAAAPLEQVTVNGYYRVVQNGQARYCRTQTRPGSHIETTVCYTKQQLATEQARAKQYIDELQRLGGLSLGAPGSCQHSAASSCTNMNGSMH
ncbi:MAG: tetratricopeptide repeat protein [Steroidobacteraceae bacterium]